MMIKKNFLCVFAAFAVILMTNLCACAKKPYTVTEYQQGIYVIEIDAKNKKYELVPYAAEELEYNEDVYKQTGAELSVNAGFFDPENMKTVSYAVLDGKIILNPKDNENLMNNEHLSLYIDKILNRTEFRILKNEKGEKIYDIAPRNAPVKEGLKLLHSIQAGPMLLPELRLEEEFFILVKDGEIKSRSASCLQKYARTGIGIKNNKVYIFIASKENPLTLQELAEIMRSCGMEKAMAFDGGGSTSFDADNLHIISDYKTEGRKVKSFLILKKKQKKNFNFFTMLQGKNGRGEK